MEQSLRLSGMYLQWKSAAVALNDGNGALICFSDLAALECELFDTETVVSTFQTTHIHVGGGLALYKEQPTSVGSVGYHDYSRYVETLGSSGWSQITDFPKYWKITFRELSF